MMKAFRTSRTQCFFHDLSINYNNLQKKILHIKTIYVVISTKNSVINKQIIHVIAVLFTIIIICVNCNTIFKINY
jgi:hypothetical protein